jgi:hypothetical protein
MSTVQDFVDCPQCGFGEADYLCTSPCRSQAIMCQRCGYQEDWDLKYNPVEQDRRWQHAIRKGFGVMSYLRAGAPSRPIHFLHTKDELLDAERWLRDQLASGAIATQSAYLTCWNDETKNVEVLLGNLDIA